MFLWQTLYFYEILVGTALLISAPITIFKIYKGSKVTFAYTMLSLTCAYGVAYIGKGAFGLST